MPAAKTLLYRSGPHTATPYPQWLQQRVDFVDSLRPVGHAPRTGSLYCSPDENMFAQWHGLGRNSNSLNKSACRVWVNPEELHVYPTLPYEQGVRCFDHWVEGLGDSAAILAKAQEYIRQYWSQGIALSNWNRGTRPDDDHGWELYETLVPTASIVRCQAISAAWMKKKHQTLLSL